MKKPAFETIIIEGKGRSLVAARKIYEGEIVIVNHMLLISNKRNNCETIRRHVIEYNDYFDAIMLGEATLLNHSDNPNVEWLIEINNLQPKVHVRSLKTIKKGEELLVDYGPDYLKHWE